MKKKTDVTLIVSSLVCLLPIVFALVIYDKLPEQIAIHWNSAGNPDNYLPKAIAAFGLPVALAVINVLVHIKQNNDPKRMNASQVLKTMSQWALPAISVIAMPITFFIAMGTNIPIHIIIPALVGVLIVAAGNYLPKCKRNYTMGIKLPWTLASDDNWNKTHRVAGFVWVLCGVVMVVNAFLGYWLVYAACLVLLVAVPFAYSFALYKKSGEAKPEE